MTYKKSIAFFARGLILGIGFLYSMTGFRLTRKHFFIKNLLQTRSPLTGLVGKEKPRGLFFAHGSLLFVLCSLLIAPCYAVTGWTTDPVNCDSSYLTIDCPEGETICAYQSNRLSCAVPATVNAALPSSAGTADNKLTSGTGGYQVNCTRDASTCTPYSSLWECKASTTCAAKNLKTVCTASAHTSSCGTCLTGYLDCNGVGTGVDADGCEIQVGGTCTLGELSGTYDTACQGSNPPTCITPSSSFTTGTLAEQSTSNPLLWGKQYGSGYLMNLSKDGGNSVVITNAGNVGIGTTTSGAKLNIKSTTSESLFIMEQSSAGTISPPVKYDFKIGTTGHAVNLYQTFGNADSNIGSSTSQGWITDYVIEKNTSDAIVAPTNFKGWQWMVYNGSTYANLLNVSSGGNVGIGTTAPNRKLQVAGNTAITNSDDSGAMLLISSASLNSIYSRAGQASTTALPLNILMGNTEAMRITGSGNVGIGTTSPSTKLHINGGVGSISTGLSFGDGDTGIYESVDDILKIQLASASYQYFFRQTDFQVGASGATGAGIRYETASTTNPVFVPINDDPDTGIGGDGANVLSLIAGGVNGLNVDGSGNVGIGTTSPGAKFEVKTGTSNGLGEGIRINRPASTNYSGLEYATAGFVDWGQGVNSAGFGIYENGQAATTRFLIQDGGNVGIGTTTPWAKLDVDGDVRIKGTNQLYFDTTGTEHSNRIGTTNDFWLSLQNARGNASRLDLATNDIRFSFNTLEAMRLLPTGRLGIGTTVPTAQLHTKGTLSTALTGTVSVTAAATAVTGTGTAFTTELAVGDAIKIGSEVFTVSAIGSATSLTLDSAHTAGASGATAYKDSSLFALDTGDGVNKFFVQSNGNVGMGTNAPLGKLHSKLGYSGATPYQSDRTALTLEGNSRTTLQFLSPNTADQYIIFGDPESRNSGWLAYDHPTNLMRLRSSGDIDFYTGSGTQMTVKSTGNVGIGTTSPSSKLQVAGTVTATAFVGDGSGLTGIDASDDDLSDNDTDDLDEGSTNLYFTNSRATTAVGGTKNDAGTTVNDLWSANKISSAITNATSGAIVEEADTLASVTARGATTTDSITTGGLTVDTTTLHVDATGNKVGIGTTSPGSKLHVHNGTDQNFHVISGTSWGSDGIGFSSVNDAATGFKGLYFGASNFGFISGNVGIGTTTPGAKLDISSGNGNGLILGGDNSLSTRTDLTNKYGRMAVPHYTNAEEPLTVFVGYSTSGTNALQFGGGTSVGNAATLLQFYTAADTTTTLGTERMRIDSTGNVGIGTTAPASLLNISKLSGDAVIKIANTGNGNSSGIDFIRERSTGVGEIGGAIFMDSDTSGTNGLLYIQSQSSSVQSGVTRALSAGNGVRLLLRGGTGIFSVENGASESMRILANGNVGIGTTSPATKLDVRDTNGGIQLSGTIYGGKISSIDGGTAGNLYLDPQSGSVTLLTNGATTGYSKLEMYGNAVVKNYLNTNGNSWLNGGNVGIGTTTPLAKLHVNGGVGTIATGIMLGDGDSGIFENSDDLVGIASSGSSRLWVTSSQVYVPGGAGLVNTTTSATVPTIVPTNADLDTGLGEAAADSLSLIAGGTEMLRLVEDTTDYIRVPNEVWIAGANTAGTGVVNMFKINANDEIEVGGSLNVGTLGLSEDSGVVTLVNMPVSSTPTVGTEESYNFSIDSSPVLKIYSEADGAGGTQNEGVIVAGTVTATSFVGSGAGLTSLPGGSLSGLSDTTITAAASGDFLRHNGTAWVDATLSAGDIPNLSATYQPLDADLTDLADGSLTATKVQYGDMFITTAGTSGQVWKSDGTGAGAWGADNNTVYTHPNHSGDVTSTGDGATAIAAGVIVDADINASAAISASKIQYGDMFITTAGTAGQVWKSDGTGAGAWASESSVSEATIEGYIANDVTTNYVPRDNGTKLVTGSIFDDGTNVGIGTASPQTKLHLQDTAVGATVYQQFTNDGTGATATDGLKIGLNSIEEPLFWNFENTDMKFATNNDLKMVIQKDGNVGIGTATPNTKLGIQTTDIGTTLSSSGSILKLANSDTTINNIAAIDFPQSASGSGFSRIGVLYKDRTASSEDQDMFFRTIGNGSSVEVLRLTSTGNVGIGTASPVSKLHINGTPGALSSGIAFGDGDSGLYESVDDTIYLDLAGSTRALWSPSGAQTNTLLPLATKTYDLGSSTRYWQNSYSEFLKLNSDLDGTAAAPSLAFGDGDTGLYESADDTLSVSITGVEKFQFVGSQFNGKTATAGALFDEAATATNPTLISNRTDPDTGIGSAAADQLSLIAGGKEGLRVNTATTAVNFASITPSATGADVIIGAEGTDTNIDLALTPKGSGKVVIPGTTLLNFSTGSLDANGSNIRSSANFEIGAGKELRLPLENDATTPTIAFGDGDSGLFESSDDRLIAVALGTTSAEFVAGGIRGGANPGDWLNSYADATATAPNRHFVGDTDTGIGTAGADQLSLIAGGTEMLRLVEDTTDYIRVPNNVWVAGADSAGTGVVNMFKVNASNEIEIGGNINIGTMGLAEDSGAVTLANMPVSATPTVGTEESYSFSLDSGPVLTVYGEADGTGGVQNQAVVITGDLNVSGTSTLSNVQISTDSISAPLNSDMTIKTGTSALGSSLVVKADGKVGIGTTTPETKLDIAGGSLLIDNNQYYSAENTSGTNYKLAGVSSGNIVEIGAIDYTTAATKVYGGDHLAFLEGGTEYMRLTGGNVGIGTTAPTNPQSWGRLLQVSNTGTNGAAISVNDATANGEWNIASYGSNLRFANGANSPALLILQTGNVGIGTTSPTKKLDVVGTGQVSGEFFMGGGFDLYGGAGSRARDGLPIAFGTDRDYAVVYSATGDTLQIVDGYTVDTNVRIALDNTGKVGIGTTTPAEKLDVAGTVKAGESYFTRITGTSGGSYIYLGTEADPDALGNISAAGGTFNIDSSNGDMLFKQETVEKMRLTTTGNVGIGTTGPGAKLDVVGDVRVYDSGVAGSGLQIDVGTANLAKIRAGYPGDFVNTNIQIQSSTASGLDTGIYLKAGGNVGIGTTSPSYPLEIASTNSMSLAYQRTGVSAKKWGFMSDNSYTYWYNISDSVFGLTLSNAGNVGIGTNTPAAKLDVNGTIRATQLCDENGANCKDISANQWDANSSIFVGVSASSNGNAAHDTLTGYRAANDLCDTAVSGSHVCSVDEMTRTIAMVSDLTTLGTWSASGTTQVWINSGGAKYAPAVRPADDCTGWTQSTNAAFGNFWILDSTSGGRSGVGYCNTSKAFACCK